MKFNWEILRSILLHIEENVKQPCADYIAISVGGYSRAEIDYHIKFAVQAKLISAMEGLDFDDGDFRTSYSVRRIHASGHSFLENTRSQEAVKFIRDGVAKINNGSFDAVCQLSTAYLKKQLAELAEAPGLA